MLELRTKFVKANLTSTGLSLQDWKQSLLAYPSFTVLPGSSSKICSWIAVFLDEDIFLLMPFDISAV